MQVGELIDLLQIFRGRGDDVVMEDENLDVYKILGIRWDDRSHVVVVDTEYVGG